MTKNVKAMLAEANATVPKLSPAEAADKLRSENVLVVDVRDPTEVQQSGKLKGALNVSRGMLGCTTSPNCWAEAMYAWHSGETCSLRRQRKMGRLSTTPSTQYALTLCRQRMYHGSRSAAWRSTVYRISSRATMPHANPARRSPINKYTATINKLDARQ